MFEYIVKIEISHLVDTDLIKSTIDSLLSGINSDIRYEGKGEEPLEYKISIPIKK